MWETEGVSTPAKHLWSTFLKGCVSETGFEIHVQLKGLPETEECLWGQGQSHTLAAEEFYPPCDVSVQSVCSCSYMYVCMHVEARGQLQVHFSVTLHVILLRQGLAKLADPAELSGQQATGILQTAAPWH